ncbi:hypothetical protein [Saccharospirillum salsuginis]|nr:hypothetical protein [Saccharospirillum salsuginis]
MQRVHCALAGTLALSLLLQGCSVTDSENVKTAGISAAIEVVSTSSDPNAQAHVSASLQSGSGINGTDLKLTGGDRLYVTADGQKIPLSESSSPIGTTYEAWVSSSSTHTEYIIGFEREEDTSAPSSTVMLPEPFDIQSMAKETYGFDEDVDLNWSPSGDNKVSILYTFDCRTESGDNRMFGGLRPSVDDDGHYAMDLSDVIPDGEDPVTACDADVAIQRTQKGQLDPNFGEGGSIKGVQKRTVTFDVS